MMRPWMRPSMIITTKTGRVSNKPAQAKELRPPKTKKFKIKTAPKDAKTHKSDGDNGNMVIDVPPLDEEHVSEFDPENEANARHNSNGKKVHKIGSLPPGAVSVKEEIECKVCGKKVVKRKFKAHFNDHKYAYKCSFCKEIFERRRIYVLHVRQHYIEQDGFQCSVCKNYYVNRYFLEKHLEKHAQAAHSQE